MIHVLFKIGLNLSLNSFSFISVVVSFVNGHYFKFTLTIFVLVFNFLFSVILILLL